MSWTCPRCQQPVFFGEARAEEGGGDGASPEDARSWRLCGLRPPLHLWGAGPSGGLELASGRPSSWSFRKQRRAGIRRGMGAPAAWPSSPQPGSTLSPTAEKVSSLGKNWHRFCLKCERCHSVLSPGGHAEVRPGQGAQPCVCPCSASTKPQFQPRRLTKGNVSSQLPRPPTQSAPQQPGLGTPELCWLCLWAGRRGERSSAVFWPAVVLSPVHSGGSSMPAHPPALPAHQPLPADRHTWQPLL